MDKSKEGHVIPINIPVVDVLKKPPQAKRFKGKDSDSSSTPVSPEKNIYVDLKRSQSVPNNDESLFLDNEEPNGKNPIKALALRSDIQTDYTENLTGVAERETRRLIIEKLAKTSSHLAIKALAGLASKEDFKAVPLKKGTGPTILQPFKNLMLLHVKGQNHVQTRLVNPVAERRQFHTYYTNSFIQLRRHLFQRHRTI